MTNIISLKIPRDTPKLRDVALQKLKNAILMGYFQPNQRLVERTLCEQLNVSRTIVREITRYLEADGLIENIPNKGTIVAPLDWETTEQIYKIRLMIETEVASECAKIADNKIKADLKQALKNIQINYSNDDIIILIESIYKFYKIIFDATNQNVAWDIVNRLNGKINRLRAITLSTDNRHISGYKRMQSIYEAISENSPTKTKKAVRKHINEATKIAHKALKHRPEKPKDKPKKGYWIADVTITDMEKYKQYVAITPDIMKKYGAKFIVRGGQKQSLEGSINERIVIIEFESVEKALQCYNSKEYKYARTLRKGACEVNVTIVEAI